MKKKMISYIAIVLMIVLAFTMSVTAVNGNSSMDSDEIGVYADAEGYIRANMDEIIHHIVNGGTHFAELSSQISQCVVGSSFDIIEIDNISITGMNVKHFPIICNNEILAVISVNKSDEGYSCVINRDLGAEINKITDKDVILVNKGTNLYSVSKNGINTLVINDSAVNFTESDLNTVSGLTRAIEITTISDAVMASANHIECASYMEGISTSVMSTNAAQSLSNFPIVGQGGRSICWAACIASMSNYVHGTSYTATSLIDEYPDKATYIYEYTGTNTPPNMIFYQAATFSNIRFHIFPYYFEGALPYLNAVTKNLVQNTIDDGVPMYISTEHASETDYNNELYHAVVVYGYNFDDSTYSVYIMDPWCNDEDGNRGGGGYVIAIYDNGIAPAYYSMGGTGTTMYFRRALVPNED